MVGYPKAHDGIVLQWFSAAWTRRSKRRDLLLEFVVLRHQLAVLQRVILPSWLGLHGCRGCRRDKRDVAKIADPKRGATVPALTDGLCRRVYLVV